MTNKEIFIKEIENTLHDCPDFFSEEALAYFQTLKNTAEKEKPMFTENGAKVLQYMKDNYQSCNNIFKAKEVAEGLFLPSSRSASGAMRKLITDGYVDKIEGQPICYSLTELGMTCIIPTPEADEA
jgi:hypothetical protein